MKIREKKIWIFLAIFILGYIFIGIDMEFYLFEHEIWNIPIPFFKKGYSIYSIYIMPVDPYNIIYNDLKITTNKMVKLQDYCNIRFGENLSNCVQILEQNLKKNGFYKAG